MPRAKTCPHCRGSGVVSEVLYMPAVELRAIWLRLSRAYGYPHGMKGPDGARLVKPRPLPPNTFAEIIYDGGKGQRVSGFSLKRYRKDASHPDSRAIPEKLVRRLRFLGLLAKENPSALPALSLRGLQVRDTLRRQDARARASVARRLKRNPTTQEAE
jgi:hypothetical protein